MPKRFDLTADPKEKETRALWKKDADEARRQDQDGRSNRTQKKTNLIAAQKQPPPRPGAGSE